MLSGLTQQGGTLDEAWAPAHAFSLDDEEVEP
jgi:hypothetical protein